MGHNKTCEQIFYILSDHENHFPAMTKDKNFHVIVLFLSIF